MAHSILTKALILVSAADGDLTSDPAIFADKAQRELAMRIAKVCKEFAFTECRMFQAMIVGKSDAYTQALVRKFSEPNKRSEMRREFTAAFEEIEHNDKVFDYLPSRLVDEVKSIQHALRATASTL
ncbi:MAG: hypothetical protein HYS18_11525 [Burkholderiales bacterium]|nr:hypothetical protein [Burkholderiales bacterium]